jgi:hypothetical protein
MNNEYAFHLSLFTLKKNAAVRRLMRLLVAAVRLPDEQAPRSAAP